MGTTTNNWYLETISTSYVDIGHTQNELIAFSNYRDIAKTLHTHTQKKSGWTPSQLIPAACRHGHCRALLRRSAS